MNRYHLIVQHYLKIGDYNSLINTCKRLGEVQPCLWLQALTGLRDDENAPVNLLYQVLDVIGKLENDPFTFTQRPNIYLILSFWFPLAKEKLQSPLQILLCLAVENGPNISAVREYFLQSFQNNNDTVKSVSCDIFSNQISLMMQSVKWFNRNRNQLINIEKMPKRSTVISIGFNQIQLSFVEHFAILAISH